MKEISVEVNRQTYKLTAEPSAEPMVRDSVVDIDRHARELACRLGHVPEPTLLLLAGIQALSEARERARDGDDVQREMARALRGLASRVRGLASSLAS